MPDPSALSVPFICTAEYHEQVSPVEAITAAQCSCLFHPRYAFEWGGDVDRDIIAVAFPLATTAGFLCAADCWNGFSPRACVIIGSCGCHIPLTCVAHLTEDAICLLCLRHVPRPNSHSQGTNVRQISSIYKMWVPMILLLMTASGYYLLNWTGKALLPSMMLGPGKPGPLVNVFVGTWVGAKRSQPPIP